MSRHITEHRAGFGIGYTPITNLGSSINMEFGIMNIPKGRTFSREEDTLETAIVVMSGKGVLDVPVLGGVRPVERKDVFSPPTSSFLLPKKTPYSMFAREDLEIAVLRAKDDGSELLVREGHEVYDEQRGQGTMDNTCHRIVRAIFDYSNAPKSNIVIGEVINHPGRFSSYPDHSHPQEEIYHYRFAPEQGWGFAKHGDSALVTRNNDTVVIEGGKDHPQAAAPGYRMYYLWAIRHLEGNPYKGFEYNPEHEWLTKPDAKVWSPK